MHRAAEPSCFAAVACYFGWSGAETGNCLQDSQEFFKLLLSTLEKRLQDSDSQVCPSGEYTQAMPWEHCNRLDYYKSGLRLGALSNSMRCKSYWPAHLALSLCAATAHKCCALNDCTAHTALLAVQEVARLVPALFRGESAYETRCQACGRLSEGSHRAAGFYELDVQVQGAHTLEFALVRLIGPSTVGSVIMTRSVVCMFHDTWQHRQRTPRLCLWPCSYSSQDVSHAG